MKDILITKKEKQCASVAQGFIKFNPSPSYNHMRSWRPPHETAITSLASRFNFDELLMCFKG